MMICPRCGTENESEQSYCRHCGLTLLAVQLAIEGGLDEALVRIKSARKALHNGVGVTVMSLLILILGHLVGAIGGNLLILTPFDLIAVGLIGLIGVPLIIRGVLGIEKANKLLGMGDEATRSTLLKSGRSSAAVLTARTTNPQDSRLQIPEPVTEQTTRQLEEHKRE